MSNVLVISTSLRAKSNSDILTEQLINGARDAGHEVEHISLKGKELGFCIGCLACQKTQKCVLKDDAVWIAEKVKSADTLVFVTPIYYYEMSGQMKTLLDRMNPLYPSDYSFRNPARHGSAICVFHSDSFAFTHQLLISGSPGFHGFDNRTHGFAQIAQRVFHSRRHFGENRPGDDLIAFQSAEVVCQYLLADPGNGTEHLVESPRTSHQIAKDQHLPFVSDELQGSSNRALRQFCFRQHMYTPKGN